MFGTSETGEEGEHHTFFTVEIASNSQGCTELHVEVHNPGLIIPFDNCT